MNGIVGPGSTLLKIDQLTLTFEGLRLLQEISRLESVLRHSQ